MQKTANVLLVLSAEERDAAQKFVQQRLKTLDSGSVDNVQSLIQMSRHQIRQLEKNKAVYARSFNRAGMIMVKLHDAALSGLNHLIQESSSAAVTIKQETGAETGDSTPGSLPSDDEAKEIEAFLLPCALEDEEHATEYMKDKIQSIEIADLKRFRDASQELLSWWESERGQIDSLHLNQIGDINSPRGRLRIRQKRTEFQTDVINPFKTFFRDLNILYQRTSKEAEHQAAQEELLRTAEDANRATADPLLEDQPPEI